ncbi:hypothetical protein IW136_006017, partial [Coemansia sp. RSA 678]
MTDEDDVQPLEAPPRNFQRMRALIMRESLGCDNYVRDCLLRLRTNANYTNVCWQNKAQFVRRFSKPRDDPEPDLPVVYPGMFLQSLISQLSLVVKRHMAYNLMLTSMLNKLLCIGDNALSAYLFLANSATVPSAASNLFLYDAFVNASADAYVKSERVPKFSARLARQLREGVETAVRVGAAHPMASKDGQVHIVLNPPREELGASGNGEHVLGDNMPLGVLPSSPTDMDVDSSAPVRSSVNSETGGRSSMGDEIAGCSSMNSETAGRSGMNSETAATKNRNDAAAAATFLGTPVKRFVNGYIVLDEFGKEMAALAMALHTLELDRQMDRIANTSHADVLEDEYADLLEYYDPEEPAYKQAMSIRTSLQPTSRPPIIDLGSQQ